MENTYRHNYSILLIVTLYSVFVNLKLPRASLKDNFFRLNFSFADSDDRTNLEPSIIWWRQRWGKANDYPQSGIFYIKD